MVLVTGDKTASQRVLQKRKEKKKRRLKFILFWIKLFLALGLITGIVMLFALSSVFNINHFSVEGSSRYSNENVVARSGILPGSNGFKSVSGKPGELLGLRCGRAEQKILSTCPYLKKALVRFVLPDTIKITLEDRQPAFIVNYLGTSLVMDEEGYVVEVTGDVADIKLPQLEGLTLESFELGKRINESNNVKLSKAAELIKAIGNADKESENKISGLLTSIDVEDIEKVTAVIDRRISVNLGDLSELDYRIMVMKQIFFKNIKKSEKGILDFTAGENPIFKPQAELNNKKGNGEE